MSDAIRVLMVDDHELFRDSVSDKLGREPDITVVGTASNADEGIEQALAHKPAVIIMDIDMPGLLCFEAARQILSRLPETRIVFLSAYCHDAYVEQALKVQARGYLTKREPFDSMVMAVRTVAQGGIYYSPDVEARITVDSTGARLSQAPVSRRSTLSAREVEVLKYIARGMTAKEIAQVMHLSHRTVDNHTTRIMNKLDIHSRVELTRFAIREGLDQV